MAMAGSLALALATLFTPRDSRLRQETLRAFGSWTLFWSVPLTAWALVYYQAIPTEMMANLPVAFGTLVWADKYETLLVLTIGVALVTILLSLWAAVRAPRAISLVWLVPFLCLALLLGQFERARQFIRKPYVLAYYMYSNGVVANEAPHLAKTGLLANYAWARTTDITDENRVQAGREVFLLACSRCHTLNGSNSITGNLTRLYPGQTWNSDVIDAYVKNIHGARIYMPPFPGTAAERGALAVYLARLQEASDRIPSNASTARN
jgi:mono/diheme cytochrome c family protein